MVCRVYELKIDKSHLTKEAVEGLRRLFLEAKWFYNRLVASGDLFHADYKLRLVSVKNKEGEFETRELKYLSSQMRQEIVDRTKDSIESLSRLKGTGRKVGKLKFKSRTSSIPLKQYDITYRIRGNKVFMQAFQQPLRVRGIDQLSEGVEIANATLEQKCDDFYIHLTTYQEQVDRTPPMNSVGVDAGVKHQLTLSSGLQIDAAVPVAVKVRMLHRKLSRMTAYGRNWFKTRNKLDKEYHHLENKRKDIRHKIVTKLVSTYDSIASQADNISFWQRVWGRKVAASAIGGIMSDLRTKPHTPIVLGRFEPTTRECSDCEALNEICLGERIYQCKVCGLRIDRDLNAAINVWRAIPAERRESTPVDTKTTAELMEYFNSVPGCRQVWWKKQEAGFRRRKPTVMTGGSSLFQAHGAVLQPEVGRLALAAPLRVERIPRPAPEADLEEEPPLLGDLLLCGVCDWHCPDLGGGSPSRSRL